MDYLIGNWGSFVGLLEFLVSIGGLVYAFLARRAAKSAEQAAREARQALTRSFSSVDIERAIALIGRLKDIHDRRNWDYALGIYPDLRRVLSQISESIPSDLSEYRNSVSRAVPQITTMENLVRRSRDEEEGGEPEDIASLDETLNEVQQDLEALQSSMIYSE